MAAKAGESGFWAKMNVIVPLPVSLALVEPHYHLAGNGRQLIGSSSILRVYLLQSGLISLILAPRARFTSRPFSAVLPALIWVVPSVGGDDAKPSLSASLNAMLLHEPLHTLLAHANALRQQLPPLYVWF